ncbi:hypothetical protein JIN84_20630 [Luteolibacter yonseiensis]|uniref:Uncharacterized protein n=1 Tax=Luteolibacter yonseiensis TaxID=1144680 RepID=A0A934R8C4_9BACT|nr:hypothetical protein [Luteolibacter yonseiensis]MBK1818041.1 hypothetical protein [Luteolibacter yonseiensis]
MSSRMWIILFTAAGSFVAGWLGYRQAHPPLPPPPAITKAARQDARRTRPADTKSEPLEELRLLRERPFNLKTSGEAWTVISRFSIRQIREALAEISAGDRTDAAMDQEAMLYFCWAQIDPLEALEAAGGKDEKQTLHSAFTGWMKKDPDAAYQWAMKSSRIDKKLASLEMATLLYSLPPAEALEKAEACDPQVKTLLLGRIGNAMAETEEERAEFLTMLANSGVAPGESAYALKAFVRSWADSDPAAALDGLDDLQLDGGVREQTRRQLLNNWIEKDPAAVIAWMTSGENPQPVKEQVAIYQKWAERAPEDASMAFENLSQLSPGFRDTVMKNLLASYHQGGWIPFGRNSRSDAMLFSRLKTHYDLWTTHDPGQASAWLASVDPALQERLKSPDNDEKN